YFSFIFYSYFYFLYIHSFPTRRSSDLFLLQLYFLNKRFESIKKAFVHKNNILDRSIYEDWYFCKKNMELGRISELEMSIYESLRSEEHTSELQSRFDLVCRLLLEKKK